MKPSSKASAKSPVGALIAPVKRILILACSLQAVSAAAGVIPFIAVAELGRALLQPTGPDAQRAWWIAGIAVVALAVRLLCQMAAAVLTHFADLDFQRDLKKRMAHRLSRAPLGWFDNRNAGAVKKALQDDVAALHHLIGHSYTDMVAAVVTPLVALLYLFWADWRLALVALVPVALGIALYSLQFRGYEHKMKAYNEAMSDVNAAAVEFAQGIAVIKTFGQARQAYGRFVQRTQDFIDYFWHWVRGMLKVSAATEIVLSPLFVLLIVSSAGLALVALGLAVPIDVLPVIVLAPALAAPLLTLSYASNDLMLAKPAAERIVALLETEILETAEYAEQPVDHRVVYDQVSFSYGGETDAVQDIDLVLEPGTVTALVGPSGSGKSTLARLLPRFWDVSRGSIRIGGVNVAAMQPNELYSRVGFVFQHVQLIRATLAENIALGRPDASPEQIERAARVAHIHERMLELPRGYDSVAGVDAHLSGGEAQRVSIARALLADAPILVLDEATAFADPEAEAAIQSALSKLIAGRTLLVIAHRLHTITQADQICVMDNGRIVERGLHAQLLEQDGLYARLWRASEAGLDASAQVEP